MRLHISGRPASRRTLSLCAALWCLWGATCAAAVEKLPVPERAARIPWLTGQGWDEIRDRAGRDGSPILIDFTATWCAPCKLLDAMVFNDGEVIRDLEDVVPFQVDIDDTRYGALKDAFNVQRLPTLIWCSAEGREIDRFTGYRSADAFLAIVAGWREGSDTFLAARQRAIAQPENPDVLLDLAERWRMRFEDDRAEVLYRRLSNLGERADCLTRARGMLGLADVAGRTGRRDLGRDLARRTVVLLGDCADDQVEGLQQVARCQTALGDTVGLMETWRTLMTLDDRDIAALEGFARAALQQRRDLEAASKAALRAAVLSDMDPHIVGTLAECYHLQGRYRRAIRWIRKSIEAAPDEVAYRDLLKQFEESLRQDPYGYHGVHR